MRVGFGLAVGLLLLASPRRAEAYAFQDILAWVQRGLHYGIQFKIMLDEVQRNREIIEGAYKAMKTGDWKKFSVVDTLDLVHSPWFDGIANIDKIRQATTLTVMSAEAAQRLWSSADKLWNNTSDPRYHNDPWYKRKVDSLMRQARRGRAARAAVLRQMAQQNYQLNEDLKRIDALKVEIQTTAAQKPVNQAKLSALQAQMDAIHARYQGRNLMLINQRAIVGLVGAEDAQEVFLEELDEAWEAENTRALTRYGKAFGK